MLVVEALENLLQIDGDKPAERRTSLSAELWKAYAIAAQDVANQNRLLVGDDGGWSDYAARLGTASPAGGRALFAYLAQQSKTRATRQSAQLHLAYSLQNSKLPLTATRLFDDDALFPVAELDPQARFLLGGMASESNQPRAAARYWQGLAPPPALDVDEWRLRLASVMVRGGMADAGADALRALLGGKKTLPADVVHRSVDVLQDFPDGQSNKTADELYRAMLPLAMSKERREILLALARSAETRKDFRSAADYFTEAALFSDGKAPDLPAIDARIAAAVNLARAGFKDDARAQFESLRKNVRDAEKLELIRRELLKL